MNIENSKVNFVDSYGKNKEHISEEMKQLYESYPVNYETINALPQPTQINYQQYVYNPQDYKLSNYKDRSIFESNIVEFWAPINDYVIPNIIPGRYWISSWGRTWNTNTNRPIGLSVHTKGYYQASLGTTIGTRVTRKIQRIVMLTFAYFDDNASYEVNHKDTIRTDNRIFNLEWMTPSENTMHGINNGFKKVFGHDYSSNITQEQVLQIIELDNQGYNPYVILYKLGLEGKVSPTTVRLITSGKIRTNASGL